METKIKKNILVCGFLFILSFCYAQKFNLEKTLDINQGFEDGEIYLNVSNDVRSPEYMTGNNIIFSDEGKLFLQCYDNKDISFVNIDEKKINRLFQFDFLENPYSLIRKVDGNNFLFADYNSRFEYYDSEKNELIFKVICFDMGMRIYSKSVYYDEKTDILFFIDFDKQVHCVINPSLDNEENKRNYRNPNQTEELLQNGYNGKFRVEKEVDNIKIYIDNVYHNLDYEYGINLIRIDNLSITYNKNKKRLNIFDGTQSVRFILPLNENSVVESYAFHPCGDFYILVFDAIESKHNIYCIENTWAPDWRKKWYKEHK